MTHSDETRYTVRLHKLAGDMLKTEGAISRWSKVGTWLLYLAIGSAIALKIMGQGAINQQFVLLTDWIPIQPAYTLLITAIALCVLGFIFLILRARARIKLRNMLHALHSATESSGDEPGVILAKLKQHLDGS